MDLLRLLFGDREAKSDERTMPAYYQPFVIDFRDKQTAVAVRSPVNGDVNILADVLDLGECNTACFISGGAGGMTPEEMARTRPLIEDGLVRFAEDHGLAIVDGGTDSGVMKLLGDIRHARGYHFPLIGVAPVGAVKFPGYPNEKGYDLNPGHSHFVLTDGDDFGMESDLLARLPRALAGGGQVFGMLINGGEIVRQETYDRSMSPEMNAPLIVLAGTGRFTDVLARSYQGEPTEDMHVRGILDHSEVHLVSVEHGPAALYAELKRFLPA